MGVDRDRSIDELLKAREAYERRDWAVAFDQLRTVGDLSADDTLALATSAYLTGDVDQAVRALQAGYQDLIKNSDSQGAVRLAFWLALILDLRGEVAIQRGWVARVQRLLEHETADTVERAYFLVHDFFQQVERGDFAAAGETAAQVVDSGRRFGDPDLIALGLVCQGRWTIYSGRVQDGLVLLDEAMVGVAAGEVSPIIAGMVYCSMIEACQEVSDFARAAAWTSALTRWCDTQPGLIPFTGQCSLHRGQIMRLRGAYDEALTEFALARRRYQLEGMTAPAAQALREQGDVLRIQGKLEEAEEAYRQAAELGYEPQPGLALLWLARGRSVAAVSAMRRLLAEAQMPVQRSAMLPAAVEVMLAAGLVEDARRCADESRKIASAFGNPAAQASAAYAAASVALASGNVDEALAQARESTRLWKQIGSPYEAARARVVVARTLQELGDQESAAGEFAVARRAFAEVGALPAAEDVNRLVGRPRPAGLTERELEVLRLVAAGQSNSDIAHALVLSQKTVERHLSNIFIKLDVASRTAAAAYAHEHGLMST